MKVESPTIIKTIQIEEYWLEQNSNVYRVWRFVGRDEWIKELTPYKEIPVVKFKGAK